MTLPGFAVRNLAQRPMRTLLTVVGLAVAFAGFIILVGLSHGLERAWTDALKEEGTDMVALGRHKVDPVTATLDERLAGRIAMIQGVSAVAGELVDITELETGEVVLTTGWEESSYLWRTQPMIEGRLPAAGEGDGAALGQALAEILGKKPGDSIELAGRTFRVTGIFGTGDVRSTRLIVVRLRVLQELLGKRGKVTLFGIQLAQRADPSQVMAVQERLARAFPTLTFCPAERAAGSYAPLRMMRALAWGTSTVALVMALVLVLTTLLMSVMERTREIGILSAVGWPASRVAALLACEGLLLTATGSVLGSVAGILGLRELARLREILGSLKPEITASFMGEIVAGALLLGVLASGYAAWQAAGLEVTDALRAE